MKSFNVSKVTIYTAFNMWLKIVMKIVLKKKIFYEHKHIQYTVYCFEYASKFVITENGV